MLVRQNLTFCLWQQFLQYKILKQNSSNNWGVKALLLMLRSCGLIFNLNFTNGNKNILNHSGK